jgi:hypothetical protein
MEIPAIISDAVANRFSSFLRNSTTPTITTSVIFTTTSAEKEGRPCSNPTSPALYPIAAMVVIISRIFTRIQIMKVSSKFLLIGLCHLILSLDTPG